MINLPFTQNIAQHVFIKHKLTPSARVMLPGPLLLKGQESLNLFEATARLESIKVWLYYYYYDTYGVDIIILFSKGEDEPLRGDGA